MKNKFIRTVPLILVVISALITVVSLTIVYVAVIKLINTVSVFTVVFLVSAAVINIISVLSMKELLTSGIRLYGNRFIITSLDENNEFYYADVLKIDSYKDTSASLKKGFTERYTSVIIFLKNGETVTAELGITTKKTINKIISEINQRL
ncbi:MAG: hypothetical protein K6C14_08705 [Eubacterium sp.]|nr:hypothetical protein [Eubacterium sp.]